MQGVIDLVEMTGITWDGEELGATFQVGAIPEEYAEQAAEYREMMLDMIVDQDDAVMEAYLDVRALNPPSTPDPGAWSFIRNPELHCYPGLNLFRAYVTIKRGRTPLQLLCFKAGLNRSAEDDYLANRPC